MLFTADLFLNLFSFLEPKQYLHFPDSQLPLKSRKLTNKSEYVFRESSALDSLGLLVNFLDFSGKWESGKCKYCFGSRKENKLRNKSAVKSIKPKLFYSTAKKNLNVSIIQSKIQDRNSFKNEAIKKGNLIHSILAKVYVKSDVDDVINEFLKVGLISKTESEEFSKIVYSIVAHPKLSSYYKIESEVINEREILTQNEQIIIPDRLVLNNDNEAIIIDYKTGDSKIKSLVDGRLIEVQLPLYSIITNYTGISFAKIRIKKNKLMDI
jgi:hypothetical protein